MLTVENFRDRASIIYSGQRDREKKRLEKALPKGVTLKMLGEDILPYTRQEFYTWLWKRVGLQAILCPYCNAPIDILTLVVDHKTPLKLGGGIGLDNQEPICKDCNGAKGKLLPDQFTALIFLLRELGPAAEADVLSRLRMGGGFLRTAFINRKQKQLAPPKRGALPQQQPLTEPF